METPFTKEEAAELDFLYSEWAHPFFVSIQEYARLMEARPRPAPASHNHCSLETCKQVIA